MKKILFAITAITLALSLWGCAFVSLPVSSLSKDKAVSLAIEHFGVDGEKCKHVLATDDGDSYDIEFICERWKYEAEIDKTTGKITDTDVERVGD